MWTEVVYIWPGVETKAPLTALKRLSLAADFNYFPVDSDGLRPCVNSDGTIGCAYGYVAVHDRLAVVTGVSTPLFLRAAKRDSTPLLEDGYEVVSSAVYYGWTQWWRSEFEEIKLV